MLFEREQSRLPDTMGAVENYKKVESMVCEHLQLRDKITEMRDAYNELKTKDAQLQSDIRRYRSGEVKDKKKFTKGCPKEDCRGFLSTQWKCGLCKTNVCSKCLIIKELDGAGKIIEHECCQDDVKSAELIKKETRSCPSCATSIYKIEGCFAKGTAVLLWNGETKMVEDIETGDKLVGTDGTVRIVKDTVSGGDKLYTVRQTNGSPYTVNSKHTLLLKPAYFKKILICPTYIKVWWFNRTTTSFKSKKFHYTDDYDDKLLEAGAIIENIDESPVRIIIDEYLKLNNSIKKRLYGFKSQNIPEHLLDIPTVISRRMDSKPNKDHFKTSIDVSFKEFGTYYGFMVDKDNEFILPDFTAVKNCDQMWCTQCHTAFSWKSGLKVNGVVHNPHFYQWQNAGANAAPVNVPGAVMCGGLPRWYNFKRDMASLLQTLGAPDSQGGQTYGNLIGCFRASQHFTNWELDRVRRVCNTTTDNTELRIQYMVNLLTEDEFKAQIMKRDKKLAKNTALLQIYELVNTVFIETIRDVYESLTILKKLPLGEIINAIDEKMQRLNQLRSYANNELAKISVLYSQSVSIIKKDYYTETCKFSKNNIEKILNDYN
jgi:hypothetical protein